MTQDLSSAFGEPATSRLRGLLPPRNARETAPAGAGDDTTDGDAPQATPRRRRPTRRSGTDASGNGATATGAAGAGTDTAGESTADAPPKAAPTGVAVVPRSPTASTNRRWGMARVVSREHVDLLVLCALQDGPASARGIIERLRADSGGVLEAPERTVHNTLHRLARNRLLHRVRGGVGPHYGLTPIGERAARSRARQWRVFARAMGSVVGETDPG